MFNNQCKIRTIYFLVDTGRQMIGDKIGSLNCMLAEMITIDLPELANSLEDEELYVQVISYNSRATKLYSQPIPMRDAVLSELYASGNNDFGAGLAAIEENLQRFNPIEQKPPIIIAFSNASVTDDYEQVLARLSKIEGFRSSTRIGVLIGEDADKDALRNFTQNEEAVIPISDKHSFRALFRLKNTEETSMIDLKSILKQHPNCLNSRASFKSVLLDKYPAEKRMINILTLLFECGVANKIKTAQNIAEREMHSLISHVENEYGISGQYSQEAILIWAKAYGVSAEQIKLNRQSDDAYSSTNMKTPITTTPVPTSSASTKKHLGGGIYLAGYDFPAGDIKLEVTNIIKNHDAIYYAILRKNSPSNDIVSNGFFNTQAILTLAEGQRLEIGLQGEVDLTYIHLN